VDHCAVQSDPKVAWAAMKKRHTLHRATWAPLRSHQSAFCREKSIPRRRERRLAGRLACWLQYRPFAWEVKTTEITRWFDCSSHRSVAEGHTPAAPVRRFSHVPRRAFSPITRILGVENSWRWGTPPRHLRGDSRACLGGRSLLEHDFRQRVAGHPGDEVLSPSF
jgi:hypothetical protein